VSWSRYEKIRCWCDKSARIRQRAQSGAALSPADMDLDEMFVRCAASVLCGERSTRHGAELDVLVQKRATRLRQSAFAGDCAFKTRLLAKIRYRQCAAIRRK